MKSLVNSLVSPVNKSKERLYAQMPLTLFVVYDELRMLLLLNRQNGHLQ